MIDKDLENDMMHCKYLAIINVFFSVKWEILIGYL